MSTALRAIYRIQLTPQNGFDSVREALPYLRGLGISHLYLSPVFSSRRGSTHGYDVVDHSTLNPELGGEAGFRALAAACSAQGMGLVLDIVPNHMAVMTTANSWWMDVLKNGAASQYADYFDIDWAPARASMRNRLLVPVLGEPLGDVIDQRGLRVEFDARQGVFCTHYADMQFPLDPQSYAQLLDAVLRVTADAPLDEQVLQEYASVRDAFAALPPARAASPEVLALRDRDQQVNRRRLARLCERQPELIGRIEAALRQINDLSDEASADMLAKLFASQPYRLAFWKVSGEEINYRRFFDVNDLAALRVEDRKVFDAIHARPRELWREGLIDGVRVDHADGLYDPAQYFHRLRELLADEAGSRTPWIVAEKILGTGERLPPGWEVDGTTGYEFAALVTGWLMHGEGAVDLERTYRRFVSTTAYADIAYQSRRQVMRSSLAAEISGLASRLDRLAQMHRNTLDFTLFDLREAIVEIIANFPVYRTYVHDGEVSSEDAQHIRRAVGAAMSRDQSARRALQFLERVLLGEIQDEPRRAAALEFTLKFQQVTAPVMAKGIEDTAYYRYPCVLAMNEVGGDPQCRGYSTDTLHRANELRQREYPRSVLATSTHDTKRGEDARYRLCVLTEIVAEWTACVGRWRRLKTRRRDAATVGGAQEYLLLQSLLAIWPLDAAAEDSAELRQRMEEYAVKAAREAKELTSWLEPEPEYEDRLRHYVALLLPGNGPGTGFARYFRPVLDEVMYFGMLNSLSACVLKFTAPGVPDTYQGNELPALVLVDPDNRRQPDLRAHAHALDELIQSIAETSLESTAARLLQSWRDGRLKLFVTWRLLMLRAENAALFGAGDYVALAVEGAQAAHLCAYTRRSGDRTLLVVASRWAATLMQGQTAAPLNEAWGDTRILLPAAIPEGEYSNVFTGRTFLVGAGPDGPRGVKAEDLFQTLPVAVLLSGGVIPSVRTAAASVPSRRTPHRA